MQSDLGIPACLDLRIPEVRAKHDRARAEWKPGTISTRGDDAPRVEYDKKGRALPASLDEAGRALLRAQERDESAETKERLAPLVAKTAADRAAKRAARDAKGDSAAKRKR